MNNRAPDFSAAFDLVDDKLADTEKRLEERRQAATKAKAKADAARNKVPMPDNLEGSSSPGDRRAKPKPLKKSPKVNAAKPELQLVTKEHRRNLTLKVLEQNERKFNELFLKLQLKGDGRKKQDLADEALDLLLSKYKQFLP